MGEAKHKKSRCNCRRIGTSHNAGCAALNKPLATEVFTLTLDKDFATVLMRYYEVVKEVEPSPGNFIVRMIQHGLDKFIEDIEAAKKKGQLVTLAAPSEIGKAVAKAHGGR